jgi:hypothetical protein
MAYHNIVSTLPMGFTTDAEFRTWGSTIKGELGNMGLVQTGDTGQIDWTTVLLPSAANQVRGYEIWRFADALQATAPIFVKLEYGSSGASTRAAIWITVGVATNGAGTLLGAKSTRNQCGQETNNTNTALCAFSGDTARLTIALWFFDSLGNQAAAQTIFFSVEREKDINGADVGTGCYITVSGNSGIDDLGDEIGQEYFGRSAGGLGIEEDPGCHAPGIGNGTSGADVSLFPQNFANGVFLPFGLNQLAYKTSAIPANAEILVIVYGATHTFRALGGTFCAQGQNTVVRGDANFAHNSSFAIRWD